MHFIKNNKLSFPVYIVSILLFSFLIFFDTWKALVDIWIRSDTYAHGFLVIPASLWLIWQNKALHPFLQPTKPSYLGLAFILCNGLFWLFAAMTQILVIQQLALVGMLIGSYWFYLGNDTIKQFIFPVLFLYFMVPIGEAQLLPHLMGFTADFTIALIRLTGLSVYREGLHFSLVSGDWSVVEACSGVRYLISSMTLGTIYAYITYRKNYKRTIFILCSIIVPIFANGMRAYMIVMIGHLSGMTLATGVDHIIYGAFFFAIIVFIMFYIGSFWRDPDIDEETISNFKVQPNTYTSKQSSIVIFAIMLGLALWPISHYQLQSHYKAQTNIPDFSLSAENNDWVEITSPNWNWQPKFNGATTESLRYFQKEESIVGLYEVNFGDEEQGAELINTQHVLVNIEERDQWHTINPATQTFTSPESKKTLTVDTSRIRGQINDFITAKWYQVGNVSTNNQYLAKIYQLYKRLTLDTSPEIYYVVFTKQSTLQDAESPLLGEFISVSSLIK